MTDSLLPLDGDRPYELLHTPDWFSELSTREVRLLHGALAFHCLVRPGQSVRATVLRTENPHYPSLTDQMTERIVWNDDRTVVGTVEARAADEPKPTVASANVVVDLGGPPASLLGPPPLPGRLNSARTAIRQRVPVAFDALRQYRTDRLENRRLSQPIPRVGRFATEESGSARGHRKSVLFGLHWLELGGAERWAVEAIGMARAAGLYPIVLSDRPSAHPDVTRPEFDDALVLPLTQPMAPEQESRLLSALFARYDIRGVHNHHCTWLYERMPWIRAHYPGTALVDSLHVLEWRTGGFVDIALRMSNLMDEHHVISPQLRDYLVDRQGLPREKVTLATLADLTVEPAAHRPEPKVARSAQDPLTVAFVGRFTQQKRPYLFLQLAARLHRKGGGRFRFLLHGDGELRDEVESGIRRLGLGSVLERRGPDRPVSATLDEADVLVISSDNEGVTLTSFEADAHDVLILSSNVGSQASVVPAELLLPRHPLAFLHEAERKLLALADDPDLAARLLSAQRTQVDAFAALPRAREWTRSLYERWVA